MRARLEVAGPNTGLLVLWLQDRAGWTVESFDQSSYFKGWIVGEHEKPFDFVGIGINDGTRITHVDVLNLDELIKKDEEDA